MDNLIGEAKKLIEMSLKSDVDKSDYSLKATDWLKRFETVQKSHQEKHDQENEASCSICGFDLICPSCGDG